MSEEGKPIHSLSLEARHMMKNFIHRVKLQELLSFGLQSVS
jgi:hypothetical protein